MHIINILELYKTLTLLFFSSGWMGKRTGAANKQVPAGNASEEEKTRRWNRCSHSSTPARESGFGKEYDFTER